MSSHPSIRSLNQLTGRNYIVTGGAQGIGYASARYICELGGNVAVLDIQDKPKEDLDALAKEFGCKVFYFPTDVSQEGALRLGFEKSIQALGSLQGLVTAAGIAIDKSFVKQTWAEVEKIQQINVGHHETPSEFFQDSQGLGSGHFLLGAACHRPVLEARHKGQHCPDLFHLRPCRLARLPHVRLQCVKGWRPLDDQRSRN